MSKTTDIQKIENIRNDVREAFTELYKEYFAMVSHLVIKNSGTSSDAADVFQDTVIALYEMVNKKSFELNSALSTLIYSIARNTWFNQLKKMKGKVEFKDFENHLELSGESEDESQVENENRMTQMESCIQEMGDPCKSILIQFYYMKKKMKQIADSLNYKTADHAKTQKYKCLKRLREMVIR